MAKAAAARPIVIKQVAAPKPKRKSRRRSRSGALSAAGDSPVMDALGGYGVGVLDKMSDENDWPTLPMIGRTGTIGLVAYYFRRSHPMVMRISRAALAIAGYQLATKGSISGDAIGAAEYDDDDDDDDDPNDSDD